VVMKLMMKLMMMMMTIFVIPPLWLFHSSYNHHCSTAMASTMVLVLVIDDIDSFDS